MTNVERGTTLWTVRREAETWTTLQSDEMDRRTADWNDSKSQ